MSTDILHGVGVSSSGYWHTTRCRTELYTVSMVSRGCSIVAELLVAGVTWWNAYKAREFEKGIKLRRSVGNVILNDGECQILHFVQRA